MSGRAHEVGAAHGAAPRTAEELTRALRGRWQGAYGTAKCPAHEDRAPSLSLADGTTGRVLVKCHAGCTFESVRDVLRRDRLWPDAVRGVSKPLRPFAQSGPNVASHFRKYPPDVGGTFETPRHGLSKLSANGDRLSGKCARHSAKSERALALWYRAAPILGTPAERYLRSRGITAPLSDSLRYLDACPHPTGRTLPAMLARVEGGDGVAVHRTYLAPGGAAKADATPTKAMLGPTRGGAVRLADGPMERLVVTEGIETGLSLLSGLLGTPAAVWAALSAGGMRALRLPELPDGTTGALIVAADGDAAGRAAAHALTDRARRSGWRVAVRAAPEGQDWNDVLLERLNREAGR